MLNNFLNYIIRKDVARPNYFKATIRQKSGETDNNLNMLVESVSFPGQNVRTQEDFLRYGPVREFAQGMTYGPISITFVCTSGLPEKKYFEEWQEKIIDKKTWNANYYETYIGEIKLEQLNRNNDTRYTVNIFEAFPKTISDQEYSMATNDSYQRITVDFSYHHWDSEEIEERAVSNNYLIDTHKPFEDSVQGLLGGIEEQIQLGYNQFASKFFNNF